MKFQKIIRAQVMLMGMAGMLLLANAAKAQQDMDPTFFDDTPGTPQLEQAAVVPAAQEAQPASAVNADAYGPMATSVAAPEFTTLDQNASLLLMVGMGLVVVVGMMGAIHEARSSRKRFARDFASSATAN